VPKLARRRGSDAENQERVELDLAEGVCRRCKNNSPSLLSCIGKRTKEGRGSEFGTVHSG